MAKTKIFSNIFAIAWKRYKSLPHDEKPIINTFLIVLAFLSASTAILEYIRGAELIPIAGSIVIIYTAIAVSSMVAIIYTLFDRLSIITPIEQKLTNEISRVGDIVERTSTDVRYMKDEFSNYQTEMRSDTEETLTQFQHYDKYLISRSKFGLNSLVGVRVHKDEGDPSVSVTREPFALKLFTHDVPSGGYIGYLISFINADQEYADAIEAAVKRGVHVKLLLMRPTADTAPAEARWRDCYMNDKQYQDYSEFISEITEKYRKFWRLERKLKAASERHEGSFQLLSYDASLSFPMIVVKESVASTVADVVYTGFYTSLDSNSVPHVEWRGGDFRMCVLFEETFESKWSRAKPFDPSDAATGEPSII